MATTEKMKIEERYKYLRIMKPRYQEARSRREKTGLLDEMEQVTGLHRKHLIHLLKRGELKRRVRGKERGKSYGPEVDEVLRVVWEAQMYICASHTTFDQDCTWYKACTCQSIVTQYTHQYR